MTPMADTGIIIIGAGRLARTIARTFPDRVSGVVARQIESAEVVANLCADALPATLLSAIPSNTWDVVWIATPDRAIPEIVQGLCNQLPHWNERTVLHSSGATSGTVLDPLRLSGATTLALHPNLSLTGNDPFPAGAYWGVSAFDDGGLAAARWLLKGLEPHFITVPDQFRSLYHASASVAANYSVALFQLAVALYKKAGVSEADARRIVAEFIRGSVARAQVPHQELRTYLTGPVVRGDAHVVKAQEEAVQTFAPAYAPAFKALTALTRLLLQTDPEEG